MNSLHDHFWKNGMFQWWVLIGFSGTAIFFSRFLVQWYATEKHKRVVVPPSFWWLSILGSLVTLAYSIYTRDPVFIVAYSLNCIPYIRNLMIHHRHEEAHVTCPSCASDCPPGAKFCSACGAPLVAGAAPSGG